MNKLEDLLERANLASFGSSTGVKEPLKEFLLSQSFEARQYEVKEAFRLAALIIEKANEERSKERLETAYRRGFADAEEFIVELQKEDPTFKVSPGLAFINYLRRNMPNRRTP
jgi:hypothetical protein